MLIDVYQFMMSSTEGILSIYSKINPLLDGESESILNDRIAAKFLASSSMVCTRSTDSIKERWVKMVATYR